MLRRYRLAVNLERDSHGQSLSALGDTGHNLGNFLPLGCRLSVLSGPTQCGAATNTERLEPLRRRAR
jgi:hypothetical protein